MKVLKMFGCLIIAGVIAIGSIGCSGSSKDNTDSDATVNSSAEPTSDMTAEATSKAEAEPTAEATYTAEATSKPTAGSTGDQTGENTDSSGGTSSAKPSPSATSKATVKPTSAATQKPVSNSYAGTLFINEVEASNGKGIMDSEGNFEDWLELYNAGSADISLKGLYLTDDSAKPTKWQFPDVKIKSKGYLLVWASEKKELTTSTELHTNFKIAAEGEDIMLVAEDGKTVIDKLTAKVIGRDQSYGRKPDGSSSWKLFNVPTPGKAN